jgi:hypothetical protein
MTPIHYAVNVIKYSIPKPVLDLVCGSVNYGRGVVSELETNIEKRILTRVLVDCNLEGHNIIYVKLSECSVLNESNGTIVVKVPSRLRGGRDLISALGVVNEETGERGPGAGSTRSEAQCRLVNKDTVEIYSAESLSGNDLLLKLNVSYDSRMSDLNPKSYPDFAKACVYAAKAYVYNELIISLDKGQLYYGHNIESIGRIVDKYEDAEQEYLEFMQGVFSKILFMNDDAEMHRWTVGMFPNTM